MVTEMVKNEGNAAVKSIWKVCMAAERSGSVLDDWTKALVVLL